MHTWLLFNQRLFHWTLVFKQRPNSSPCLYGLLDQELLQVWHLSWCPTNNTKPLNEQKYNTNRHIITGRSRRWSWTATPLSFPPFLPSLLPSPSFTSLLCLLHPSYPLTLSSFSFPLPFSPARGLGSAVSCPAGRVQDGAPAANEFLTPENMSGKNRYSNPTCNISLSRSLFKGHFFQVDLG